MINYTPFGHADWQTIVADIKKFGSAGKKTAVVSTINGDANVPFYKELGNQGIKAKDIPVVAFSVGEEELAGIDTKPLLGHLAAWNYFQSIDTPINKEYIDKWHAFTKNPKRTFNDPMEAHVIGFAMWVVEGSLRILDEGAVIDEFLVDWRIDRLEVVPGGEVAEQRLGVEAGELFFTDRERHHRKVRRLDALVAEFLIERHVGVAVDGRDHGGLLAGRAELLDVGDDGLEVGSDRTACS